jgi:hypothetical protein
MYVCRPGLDEERVLLPSIRTDCTYSRTPRIMQYQYDVPKHEIILRVLSQANGELCQTTDGEGNLISFFVRTSGTTCRCGSPIIFMYRVL